MASGIEKPEDFIGCPIPLSDIKYLGLFRGDIDFFPIYSLTYKFLVGLHFEGLWSDIEMIRNK